MYSKTCSAKVLLSAGLISMFREVRHCIELVKTRVDVPLLCCQFSFKSKRLVRRLQYSPFCLVTFLVIRK